MEILNRRLGLTGYAKFPARSLRAIETRANRGPSGMNWNDSRSWHLASRQSADQRARGRCWDSRGPTSRWDARTRWWRRPTRLASHQAGDRRLASRTAGEAELAVGPPHSLHKLQQRRTSGRTTLTSPIGSYARHSFLHWPAALAVPPLAGQRPHRTGLMKLDFHYVCRVSAVFNHVLRGRRLKLIIISSSDRIDEFWEP